MYLSTASSHKSLILAPVARCALDSGRVLLTGINQWAWRNIFSSAVVSPHNPHRLFKLLRADLVIISGKMEVFLLPTFVSKPAEWLTQTFTHLVFAVTLYVSPPFCVKYRLKNVT